MHLKQNTNLQQNRMDRTVKDFIKLIFQSVRNYLIETGHQDFFDQYQRTDSLPDKMKRKLSDALYDYSKKMFSKDPTSENITEVCKAALSLFPLIKVHPSNIDGIVIINYKQINIFCMNSLLTFFIRF